MAQGYNSTQKTNIEVEKDLTNKTKKQIRNRYKESQRIQGYFSKGYQKDPSLGRKKPLRQTDPDKMNPVQLMQHGYDKLQKEREKEKKENNL